MNITVKIDAPELVGAINNLADAMGGAQVKPEPAKEQPAPKPEPVKENPAPEPEPQPDPEPVKEEPAPKQTGPKVQKAEVRAVLAKLSKSGKADKVAELLHEHGGEKLSAVPEDNYPSLKAKAEALL